jgi:hypothetical protein
MKSILKFLSYRSTKGFNALVAATGLLAVCYLGLDSRSVNSQSLFSKTASTSLPEQTDVDRAQHLIDADGVPFLNIPNIGKQHHPAWIALYALAYAGTEVYDERLNTLEKDDSKFRACIDWLENNLRQNQRGQWVWQYHFDSTYNDISIKAPWSSAFAQATGIQALVVAYKRTGDSHYIELAKKAAQPLFTPLSSGGFLFEAGTDIWFEEIPEPVENPSHILNGHMRVLLALADLYEATNDESIATWLKRGTDTLYRWLPRFDTGYWLRYDLNPRKKELLFRFANPYGFPVHALAIDKITLRDPVSQAEVSIDVGTETDNVGAARIAGVHWGQIETVAGRSARWLVPSALDNKRDEMGAPHTYFYLSLPGEWKDNLRDQWYELVIEYYDDAAANITIQQRSIAPGQTFLDMRDGDLHLTGAGHWRKWIIPVRPTDLGYWVGMSYAEKHYHYLDQISKLDSRFLPWSKIAKGYLNLAREVDNDEPYVSPVPIKLPTQTSPVPIYSLDEKGVVMHHLADGSTRWNSDGTFDPSSGKGKPVYNPFIVAEQLIYGPSMPLASETIKRDAIKRKPALDWILADKNHRIIGGSKIFLYFFDNAYNDNFTRSPWPSAFGQAHIIESLIYALDNSIEKREILYPAIRSAANAFTIRTENGGITTFDRAGSPWFEEVPNGTHVLNAHLISLGELSAASQLLGDSGLKALVDSGLRSLKDRLHLFDTGYWLRYDQNPKKELLFQLDWIAGSNSPLIDEVVLENPQTGNKIRLDIGTPEDSEGEVRISGTDWQPANTIDGRTVRAFANGYQIRSNGVAGGARHNVFLVLQLPDKNFYDDFDVPPHRLVVRYKDTGKGTFAVKTQAIHEGNRLTFVPLHGGVWNLQGDQQWKEAVFTIRPQDMGWYKGPDYQQYEVEQLQRIANLTNDWFFYQYAERHRDFLSLQRGGVSAIVEKQEVSNTLPITLRVLDEGGTYPGYGFDNSIDGDPNDDYTAGIENQPSFVVLKLGQKANLAAIRLHWKNASNVAHHVVVSTVGPGNAAGKVLADARNLQGTISQVTLSGAEHIDAIRVDFSKFGGQPRLLLRQIQIIEHLPAGKQADPDAPYLGARDDNNPLRIFRVPVTWRIKELSDKLAAGARSDHEKVLRFMQYINGFRVGIASEPTPDATVQERVGACGTFSGTLLALAAAQGIKGRYVGLYNYPSGNGHSVAELFIDGDWRLYDATYGAYYISAQDPDGLPLSFDGIRKAYRAQPVSVRRVVTAHRPRMEYFTGRNIFMEAVPSGVIGPDKPMVFPLALDLGQFPVLDRSSFGPKYQGADFLGAAGTNQNQEWRLTGLSADHDYVFTVTPRHIRGDINANDDLTFK